MRAHVEVVGGVAATAVAAAGAVVAVAEDSEAGGRLPGSQESACMFRRRASHETSSYLRSSIHGTDDTVACYGYVVASTLILTFEFAMDYYVYRYHARVRIYIRALQLQRSSQASASLHN